jgi:hypothetical protein
MMSLPGHVFTAPDGVRGIDTAETSTTAIGGMGRSAPLGTCRDYASAITRGSLRCSSTGRCDSPITGEHTI